MSMEEHLARHLADTLSPDANVRATASDAVEQLTSQPGFGAALVTIALTPQVTEESTRQLAAVILKKHVREKWSAHDRAFVAPEMSGEEKARIKTTLPAGLADGSSKIRTATAMAIAQVATNEWPGDWPELTTTLVDGIRAKRSRAEVLGCLKCYEMIACDMDEAALATVGPVLFPELLDLAKNAEDSATRRKARGAFGATVATLHEFTGTQQRMMRDMMMPYMGPWLETLATALDKVPNPSSFDQCATTLDALSSLALAVQYFAKPAGDALMPALSRGAMMFHSIAPVWAQYSAESDHLDPGNDSDGDAVSFEAVVTELLELVINIAEQPKLSKLLEANLVDTIYVAIGYMTMTPSQEEQWMDDPNQYVADEDDDFSTVRAACGLMLDSLCDRYGTKAIKALTEAANRRMSEAIAMQQAGDANWWKGREASLLAIGTLSEGILGSAKNAQGKGKTPPLDIAAFMANVLEVDLHDSTAAAAPFLRGRALWVTARLAGGVPPHMADAVLKASVRSLAPGLAPPLRIGACRAIAESLSMAKPEVLAPYVGEIYNGLGALLGDAGEETLHLVLEGLNAIIKADNTAAAQWLGALVPAVVKIWAQYVCDPLISADTTEVFEALAAIPSCRPQLHAILVPTLSHILAAPSEQPDMLVEATLDLLTVIVRPAETAEAKATHGVCFKYVVGLILHSDDTGILQGAAETLRAFLRAGKEDMLEWGSGDASVGGGDVLRAMFEAASRLLDPNLEDSASLYAAPLLCQMLRRLPTKVGPVLPDITRAVVARLRSSQQPNLSASLLTVFARIVHVDANGFINLLASLPSGGEEANAFEYVMKQWVEKQCDVNGSFDIKLTTSALGLLLNTKSPTLNAVVVKGQIVETPAESGRIRTRARAQATGPEVWTQVPLPVKIVELLADVLIEFAEGIANDEGDDEWEDDDDDEYEEINPDEADYDDGVGAHTDGAFTGDLFERLLMRGGLDQFDPDDEDEAEDPINAIDLKAFVVGGVKSLHADGSLAGLAASIPARHQSIIHDAITHG
jgi:hypothetical protein